MEWPTELRESLDVFAQFSDEAGGGTRTTVVLVTVRLGEEVKKPKKMGAIQIVALKYAEAIRVADLLSILFANQSATIVADERTNSIIVGIDDVKVFQSITDVVSAIDVPKKDKKPGKGNEAGAEPDEGGERE